MPPIRPKRKPMRKKPRPRLKPKGVLGMKTRKARLSKVRERYVLTLGKRRMEIPTGPFVTKRELNRLVGKPILAASSRKRPAEIVAKARELCLAKDKRMVAGTRMPRWSSAEVARLRQLYPDHSNLEIARTLGRSVTSIANKAHQLGLCKSPATLRTMGRRNVGLRRRT